MQKVFGRLENYLSFEEIKKSIKMEVKEDCK
jgi:hypothetical protein